MTNAVLAVSTPLTALTNLFNVEHKADGTHSDITADSIVSTSVASDLIDAKAGNVLYGGVNKNAIRNPRFEIAQRGVSIGPFSGLGGGYTLDGWEIERGATGDQTTVSRNDYALGQSDVPGEPKNFARVTSVADTGSAGFVKFSQKIESVRTFAGEEVTFSFYASADVGKDIAIELVQNFGSGGSPSPDVNIAPQKVTLTTVKTKHFITISVPGISGKALGTDSNDCLEVNIWLSAGTSNNSRTNTLGTQDGTFEFSEVVLNKGPASLPLQPRSFSDELTLNERYFEKSYDLETLPGNPGDFDGAVYLSLAVADTVEVLSARFSTPKRAVPSVLFYSTTTGAINKVRISGGDQDIASNNPGTKGVYVSPVSANRALAYHYTASAEL